MENAFGLYDVQYLEKNAVTAASDTDYPSQGSKADIRKSAWDDSVGGYWCPTRSSVAMLSL